MLAQSFKSADELSITEPQKEALQKTLVLLETGKLRHVSKEEAKLLVTNNWEIAPRFDGNFNLSTWGYEADCGTVACIGGTAEAISGVTFWGWEDRFNGLRNLFAPNDIDYMAWGDITPTQAAIALRSYLTTGDARWDLAVQS